MALDVPRTRKGGNAVAFSTKALEATKSFSFVLGKEKMRKRKNEEATV
jgi:hypothetical protein